MRLGAWFRARGGDSPLQIPPDTMNQAFQAGAHCGSAQPRSPEQRGSELLNSPRRKERVSRPPPAPLILSPSSYLLSSSLRAIQGLIVASRLGKSEAEGPLGQPGATGGAGDSSRSDQTPMLSLAAPGPFRTACLWDPMVSSRLTEALLNIYTWARRQGRGPPSGVLGVLRIY